jgi:hypothetical protein
MAFDLVKAVVFTYEPVNIEVNAHCALKAIVY